MTSHALTGIGELLTMDAELGSGVLGIRHNAALIMADGVITWIGDAADLPDVDTVHDVQGACVLPGFVDSHAHPVFAGDRANEFAARMAGESYAAGGIRTTVAATRAASDEQLRQRVAALTREFHHSGVTTFEAKSGYGLTVVDEARSLQIASTFTSETTYLGAHVVPAEYADDPAGYVALVTGPMLDACAPHARWIDVFCEHGAFDADQSRAICRAGMDRGLVPRLHANQLGPGPGVQLAVELGAASADHCTYLSDADVDALANSHTVATLLPGAEFSTRSPYPDARRLLAAGANIAIATDCNPGSSYTTSMPFCIALAVRDMHMTPDEAVHAATIGGAKALRRSDIGYLGVGARADVLVLNAPSYIHLAYRPGVDLIQQVFIAGEQVHGA
jgi:imidazolonepropionase